VNLTRGAIVLVTLDSTRGHEQRGVRPCVIVTDPEVIEDQRFPMVCVVPITKTQGEGALYPSLNPGSSGLLTRSFALVDQVRSIDKRRITKIFGQISDEELNKIDEGLRLFLGLH
jgi:mRNA interferase MazF